MSEPTDDRIRSLIGQLAESAPAAPSFQQIEDVDSRSRPQHRSRLIAVSGAIVIVAVIVGLVLTRIDDGADRVRVEVPSTQATATTTTRGQSTRMSIDIEPTALRLGDPVRIRGAGCRGSGRSGDRVQILLGNPAQTESIVELAPPATTVAADGTFTVETTVPANATPGSDQVIARCFDSSANKELAVTSPIQVTVQSPYVASLSPSHVARGGTVSFHGSCPGQEPYDWMDVEFVAADGTLTSPTAIGSFVLKGALNGGSDTVPPNAAPGIYHATPRCQEERGLKPIKYFQTVDVTVTG